MAAGAKLLADWMGGAPEEPGRTGFNPAGVQSGGSGFREGGRAGFNPAGRGGSTRRPHAYSTASEVAKARQRGSSAGRSGCASSSVVIEAAAAFIQLQWLLR